LVDTIQCGDCFDETLAEYVPCIRLDVVFHSQFCMLLTNALCGA
jgi:hypothetical protein